MSGTNLLFKILHPPSIRGYTCSGAELLHLDIFGLIILIIFLFLVFEYRRVSFHVYLEYGCLEYGCAAFQIIFNLEILK